jgi:diketogulonate reductase-like aldo/keto reductase
MRKINDADLQIKKGENEPKFRRIGIGTYGWKYDHGIIIKALDKGAYIIDTAEGYGFGRVEKELGRIISNLSEPVSNKISTKISRNHMIGVSFIRAARRSKEKLGIRPHYQIHFPNQKVSDDSIVDFVKYLMDKKIIRSIGLGNCSADMVCSLIRKFSSEKIKIRTVQIRYNLSDRRAESVLIPICKQNNIKIIAYSPLGQRFGSIKKPVLARMAKSAGATESQIALSWIIAKGAIPIPRTNNIRHLNENLDSKNIELSIDQIKELDSAYPINLYE